MQGVFDNVPATKGQFVYYAATLQFRDRLIGGIPSDAKLIEAWLMRNMGLSRADEIRHLTVQTLRDIGVNVDEIFENPEQSFESLRAAAEAIAGKSQTTVFKRDPRLGLYVESRQVKAMLRESTNIVFPYDGGANKWGKRAKVNARSGATEEAGGKTPRSYLIESISIEPLNIPIGVSAPTGIDLSVQHTTGPQGPRSSLGYYEFVDEPKFSFIIMCLRDQIKPEHWAAIWRYAQQHGLGAKRSQDFGRFWITEWKQLDEQEGMDAVVKARTEPIGATPITGTPVVGQGPKGRSNAQEPVTVS